MTYEDEQFLNFLKDKYKEEWNKWMKQTEESRYKVQKATYILQLREIYFNNHDLLPKAVADKLCRIADFLWQDYFK